jgi:hypothetical protein
MRIFKTRWFARFTRQQRIADASLLEAIARDERGLIDADLGGNLIKQRVARQGQGRSGGYRVIIAYKARDRAFFLLGFAKSERENITQDELIHLRNLANNWLIAGSAKIRTEIEHSNLQEVEHDEEA